MPHRWLFFSMLHRWLFLAPCRCIVGQHHLGSNSADTVIIIRKGEGCRLAYQCAVFLSFVAMVTVSMVLCIPLIPTLIVPNNPHLLEDSIVVRRRTKNIPCVNSYSEGGRAVNSIVSCFWSPLLMYDVLPWNLLETCIWWFGWVVWWNLYSGWCRIDGSLLSILHRWLFFSIDVLFTNCSITFDGPRALKTPEVVCRVRDDIYVPPLSRYPTSEIVMVVLHQKLLIKG